MLMRVRVVKNKAAAPYGDDPIPMNFYYGQGIDPIAEALEALRINGKLRHSGGQTKIQWTDDTDLVPIAEDMDKGKDACFDYLRANPDVFAKVHARAVEILL